MQSQFQAPRMIDFFVGEDKEGNVIHVVTDHQSFSVQRIRFSADWKSILDEGDLYEAGHVSRFDDFLPWAKEHLSEFQLRQVKMAIGTGIVAEMPFEITREWDSILRRLRAAEAAKRRFQLSPWQMYVCVQMRKRSPHFASEFFAAMSGGEDDLEYS